MWLSLDIGSFGARCVPLPIPEVDGLSRPDERRAVKIIRLCPDVSLNAQSLCCLLSTNTLADMSRKQLSQSFPGLKVLQVHEKVMASIAFRVFYLGSCKSDFELSCHYRETILFMMVTQIISNQIPQEGLRICWWGLAL